jgi:GrpB-like predicted nucleotidyltransferase (UPF0157 family)
MSWTHEAVHIVAADPGWPEAAESLARQVVPHVDGPVEHVGSTAVPGLDATPIIDLMAGVDELDDREIPGWHLVPPELDRRPYRRFHVLVADDHRVAHLHLMRTDAPRWAEQLAFRDALRGNHDLRDAYAALKRSLAAPTAGREDYTEAKGGFVRQVLGRKERGR